MKIIIVEDEKSIRNGLVKMLPKLDPEYEVIGSAKDGSEGYQRVLAEQPDLVIMDIEMPEMDGLTATKKIRKLPRADAESVPIIAMTANAFDDDRRKSEAAGMNDHLAKPIEPELLYSTLAKAISLYEKSRAGK